MQCRSFLKHLNSDGNRVRVIRSKPCDVELDVKYHFSDPANDWQTAIMVGMAYSSLQIENQSKDA